MLGGKVLHDQRKMFIAYLSAALLIVLLITAVMYANTTALVRRQHRRPPARSNGCWIGYFWN